MLEACLNPPLKSGFVSPMLERKLRISLGHDVTEDHWSQGKKISSKFGL